MSNRAKLRAGPLRLGRGGGSPVEVQMQREAVDHANTLRGALLELPERLVAYAGGYDAGGTGALRYIPWGSGGAAASARAQHALFKPFDACKIKKVAVVSTTNPAGGTIEVSTLSGTSLHQEIFSSGGANEEIATYPDIDFPDEPIVVSFFPGASIDEVGAVVVIEEVTT